MQLTTVLLTCAAALAAAYPQGTPSTPSDAKFGVSAVRSDSIFNGFPVLASVGNLYFAWKGQGATCDAVVAAGQQNATFYIQDQELHLYTGSHTPRTIFVDRSGMGQGKIGYITTGASLGRYWETKGWAITNNNELQFQGTGLQACPGATVGAWTGAWSIWLQGVAKPGFNENCVPVVAAVGKIDSPIACEYN